MKVKTRLSIAVLLVAWAALPLAAQTHAKASAPGPAPAPATAPAQVHQFKCLVGAANTPCSAGDVQDLNAMVVTGRRMWEPLALVASITPGGPDGTLKCAQTDGAPCTDAQLNAIETYAAQQKKGGPSGIHVTKSIDIASP